MKPGSPRQAFLAMVAITAFANCGLVAEESSKEAHKQATKQGVTPPCESIDLLTNDLSGWVAEGNATVEINGVESPVWTVKNGILRCSGSGKVLGFLRYDLKLDDFDLHLEYRYSPGCNSGIGLRTVPFTGPRKTRPSRAGYEIQILDEARVDTSNYKKPGLSTSIYGHIERPKYVQKPAGEWNVVDIRCQGPRIRVELNGEEIHNIDQRDHKSLKNKSLSGYICLQNHGHTIDFRNVQLTQLPKPKTGESGKTTEP